MTRIVIVGPVAVIGSLNLQHTSYQHIIKILGYVIRWPFKIEFLRYMVQCLTHIRAEVVEDDFFCGLGQKERGRLGSSSAMDGLG